jgi:hypothetical protein
MISSDKILTVVVSSVSLLSINFLVSLPARASVVCESGTITNYQNGSLASCILGQDTTVQVYTHNAGTSNFYCQAKKPISFDDKAQFQTCYLSQEIKLIKNNLVESCPAEYRVSTVISNNGIESISCTPY